MSRTAKTTVWLSDDPEIGMHIASPRHTGSGRVKFSWCRRVKIPLALRKRYDASERESAAVRKELYKIFDAAQKSPPSAPATNQCSPQKDQP